MKDNLKLNVIKLKNAIGINKFHMIVGNEWLIKG